MNMLMIAQLLSTIQLLGAAQPPVPAPDIFISADNAELVKHSPDFTFNSNPFVENHTYLSAQSSPGAAPGSIRVAAPVGEYYVYVAWARHPQGAKDVAIRIRDVEVRVDQSRLANRRVPEDFPMDDMGAFNGVCTSGLFRLTDRPVKLEAGDVLEILRSDTEPGKVTTLDYVVFSPCLYMDDVGNDAELIGRPTLNLQDYDPAVAVSGLIGMGAACPPIQVLGRRGLRSCRWRSSWRMVLRPSSRLSGDRAHTGGPNGSISVCCGTRKAQESASDREPADAPLLICFD